MDKELFLKRKFTFPAPVLRIIASLAALLFFWQSLIWITNPPAFMLPAPGAVVEALVKNGDRLAFHAGITLTEILLGLFIGCLMGLWAALFLAYFRTARTWLLPLLVMTQAIPVFALAPLLVLWLGYGMASKVAMASLIIFFPVTAAFLDGLRQTDPDWLDLSRSMNATSLRILWHVRMPAALPALGSGLRVAAAIAPIGAIVGEWVGSSAGLGYIMLHANGRMQTDLMFAALFILAGMALILYFSLDFLLRRSLPWVPDSERYKNSER